MRVTITVLGALGALAMAGAAGAEQPDLDAHLYIDRPTQPFPKDAAAPREDRPFLSECVTPMILIGHLEMPRERGGFYGAELREAPTFDGLEVEAPGYFRMLRAEDGVGDGRGRAGILGHRDPFLLRGEFISRTYRADREPWQAPDIEETRVFAAGSMERVPFARLTAEPEAFFEYLKGHPLRLGITIQNPAGHEIPNLTVTLRGEPRDASFPLARRLDLETGFDFVLDRRVSTRRNRPVHVSLRLPGKTSPAVYREAERVALGGRRWPYPSASIEHPVHDARAVAGQDLQRLIPVRSLAISAGHVPRKCHRHQGAMAVRYKRIFRSFGVVLDGLDLEIMSGWSARLDRRFTRLLETRGGELPDWTRPVVVAAMEAKQRRVPGVRQPGGLDEFDVMALHLWGAIDDGTTHFSNSEDAWGAAADHLYRHDGRVLPPLQREELRRHLMAIRGSRHLAPREGEDLSPDERAFPVEDHRLPEGIRARMNQAPKAGRVMGRRRPFRTRTSNQAAAAAAPDTSVVPLSRRDLDRKKAFEATRRKVLNTPKPVVPKKGQAPVSYLTPPRNDRPRTPVRADPPRRAPPKPTAAPIEDFDELFGAGDAGSRPAGGGGGVAGGPPPRARSQPAPDPEPETFDDFGVDDFGSDPEPEPAPSGDTDVEDDFADF